MFSVLSGPGVFTNCVNRWCRQTGPTKPQYTKCRSISNHGRTCHYPEIKYGTTSGGLPRNYKSWPHEEWCSQLGGKYSSTTLGRRTGFALYWCKTGDRDWTFHWCDSQDSDWYNSSLDIYLKNDPDFITSITCYSEKMDNERTPTSKFSALLNLKFLIYSLNT